jgi:hypothetical protein
MGTTTQEFSRKIEFACRKITLNYNMKKRIEMAFLNKRLTTFWELLINKFKLNEQITLLDDLYENAPQKMAYWDFNHFVNNFLCHHDFYNTLK